MSYISSPTFIIIIIIIVVVGCCCCCLCHNKGKLEKIYSRTDLEGPEGE